ncbi:hypothetical protein DBR43_08135 [Pedobacter sp. KBW06]|nr:hypothetical protein DBR43_08135 [Pedobacter sp. KBW06]
MTFIAKVLFRIRAAVIDVAWPSVETEALIGVRVYQAFYHAADFSAAPVASNEIFHLASAQWLSIFEF